MNRIDERLYYLKQLCKPGLMLHIVAGYPSLEANLAMVEAMAAAEVDFIEVQIPFSDPVADGPSIMRANQAALDAGTNVRDAMHLMYELSHRVDTPLLFMSYYNVVFNYGVERFCLDARKAGASGLLVPDVPPEEQGRERLDHFAKVHDLFNVRFLSPAGDDTRIAAVAAEAPGFVYCFSTFGVTGARAELDPRLDDFVARIRRQTDKPLAVGFGIRGRDQYEHVGALADVVVVGSALIDRLAAAPEADPAAVTRDFIRVLRGEA
jgi:tryptophan synthase alpha subunit